MDRIAPVARLVSTLVLVALLAPIAVRAEPFVDLRAGYAFTEDGDVTLSAPGLGSTTFEGDLDDSVTGGLRLGYWFGSLPWLGVAAEASYFGTESGTTEIDVIPVTPLLMGRVPIATSEEHPNGRVQPFLGIGPGIFVSEIDDTGYSDGEVNVGLDLHAGLKVFPVPRFAFFAQYRYTWFEAEYTDEFFFGPFTVDLDTEVEFATHHVAGGIAFHF